MLWLQIYTLLAFLVQHNIVLVTTYLNKLKQSPDGAITLIRIPCVSDCITKSD
jgi:hypothetical protein